MSSNRLMISPESRIKMAPGVMLRHDKKRGVWTLLAPERVVQLDDIAAAILQQFSTGMQQVSTAIDALARDYDAPKEEISGDVLALLQDMADRRFLEAVPLDAKQGRQQQPGDAA